MPGTIPAHCPSMAAITLENLVKRFGTHTVLQQLSLHIPDGAFYTLLGPAAAARPRCCAASPASTSRTAAACCSTATT